MSIISATSSNTSGIQTTTTTIQAPNGAQGTIVGTASSNTIAINNNMGTTTTVTLPPSGASGGTLIGFGGAGQNVQWVPASGAGGGGVGSGVYTTSGYLNIPRNLNENDLTTLVEFFSNLFTGVVLVHNETKGTKEVKPMNEGFQLYQQYKNIGDKVNVTQLNSEAAKVLYGNKSEA